MFFVSLGGVSLLHRQWRYETPFNCLGDFSFCGVVSTRFPRLSAGTPSEIIARSVFFVVSHFLSPLVRASLVTDSIGHKGSPD